MKIKILSLAAIALTSLMAAAQGGGGYQDGVDNFNAGRLDVAKIILNNTLDQPTTNKAVSYYYLGQIAFLEGDIQAAAADFDKGIAADPTNGYNIIGKGMIALKNGNAKEAETLFKEGMATNKKSTALMVAVARAYYNVNPTLYSKEITKLIEKAQKDSKFKEAAVSVLMGDMVAAENPGQAAGFYESAITQDADRGNVNSEAYVKYANTYFHVSPELTIERLEELNRLMPESALAQRELAEKYYDNNSFGRAVQQYAKYMQNPHHFQSDEQRYAGLLFSAGDYDQSLEIANKVLAVDPQNFYMHRVILLNKNAMEDWPAAVEAGRKLFGNPNASFVANDYIVYGDALLANGNGDEAVEIYQKAVELNPDKPELLSKLSQVYEKAGQPDKAVEVMKAYLDAGNGSAQDLYGMAGRYRSLALATDSAARTEAALEGVKYINMAIEKVPGNISLLRRKGELLLLAHPNYDSPEMAEIYEEIVTELDKDPTNIDKQGSTYRAAYFILGNYYMNTDKDKARAWYEKYLTVNPDDESVKRLLETL